MNRIEVRTVVHLPAEEVYEFLLDFRGYAQYSTYLRSVRQFGDGGPGTKYELEFAWWKLRYVARSMVTEVESPKRIEWELTRDIDAAGRWLVDPIDRGKADADDDPRTEVALVVEYAPGSADDGIVDLPPFVSLGWVIGKIGPKIRAEAERVVRRIVADLEGEPRDVALEIETD